MLAGNNALADSQIYCIDLNVVADAAAGCITITSATVAKVDVYGDHEKTHVNTSLVPSLPPSLPGHETKKSGNRKATTRRLLLLPRLAATTGGHRLRAAAIFLLLRLWQQKKEKSRTKVIVCVRRAHVTHTRSKRTDRQRHTFT